jgi:superfamily II DNA helicase RecQ
MHVLPREVADLWAWYVWLVLPFWSIVRSARGDGDSGVADESFLFLKPPSRTPTSWVSRALVTASARVLETGGIGLQPSRQLVMGLVRRFTPPDILSGGQSAQLDAPRQPVSRLEAAARAGVHAGAARVGRGPGGSDHGDDYDDDQEDGLWDAEDGEIDPAEVGAGFVETSDVFTGVRNLIKVRSACEIGSGHSTRTGFANYAGDAQAIPGIDELQLALWSAVSAHWHSLLRFPSALSSKPRRKRPRAGLENHSARRRGVADAEQADTDDDDGSPRASKKARTATLLPPAVASGTLDQEQVLQSLRDLLGLPNAEFRGNQWAAFDIMLNQRYGALVVVEPTGSGKTALILLPAALPTARATVVVTPFVALREQLLEQGRQAGIACVAWTAGREQGLGQYLHAKIILVAAEHLQLPSWQALVKTLHAADRVERIVVDEAHLPLVAGHWRKALRHYDVLATFGVPLVLLSGTLPVPDERRLLKGMRVDPADAHILRSSTVRRNVRYSVVNLTRALGLGAPVQGDDEDDQVVRYLVEYLVGFEEGRRKTMVFVHTVATAHRLAQQVPGAYAFHHGVEDGPRILADFARSSDGVLFCTTAAEHGIDVPDVAHVLYTFCPDSLTAYLQSAGRAGRDGALATSVLLVGKGIKAFKVASLQALSDQLVVQKYAESTQCRRSFIDEYMDGDLDRQKCEAQKGEELCDVCARTDHRPDEVRPAAPAKPPTPPPAYEALPPPRYEGGPCVTQTPESSPPFHTQMPRLEPAASTAALPPSSLPEYVSPRSAVSRPTSQLDPTRRAESMAWRAVWGGDGAARPSPWSRIWSTLSFWKTNCKAHLLAGGDSAHTSTECRDLRDEHARIKLVAKAWNEKGFVMAPWTGCWSCKVPQDFCCGRGRCSQDWAHVVVDAWATCLLHPASLQWGQAALQAQRMPARFDDPVVKAFLGKKIYVPSKPDRIETIPLIDMLVEMTELFFFPQRASLGPLSVYGNWDASG